MRRWDQENPATPYNRTVEPWDWKESQPNHTSLIIRILFSDLSDTRCKNNIGCFDSLLYYSCFFFLLCNCFYCKQMFLHVGFLLLLFFCLSCSFDLTNKSMSFGCIVIFVRLWKLVLFFYITSGIVRSLLFQARLPVFSVCYLLTCHIPCVFRSFHPIQVKFSVFSGPLT